MRRPRPLALPFPVSKPCDLVQDAAALTPAYARIDAIPDALAGQHPIRRWEYAMACYAIREWEGWDHRLRDPARPEGVPLQIGDIGGAGSQFWKVLATLTPDRILVLDPAAVIPADARVLHANRVSLAKFAVEEWAAHMPHDQFDVLTGISVLEHVPDVRPFLRACRMLLKPGGLLFLTVDYWDADGPDVAHFHWMRERIYNQGSIRKLLRDLRELGYKSFGIADWAYPGNQLYDYSVASVAVVKT